MSGNKEYYDLICSLGGNCAAAHNLKYRNLRNFAYPFDWTYFISDEAVYKLSEGFKTGFKNYMLKENLVELPQNPSHPQWVQYEDKYGKIVWANHFKDKIDVPNLYNKVKEVFDKRFIRLIEHIDKANNILFVFSTSFQINIDSFEYLLKELKMLYPNKNFKIQVISFNCEKDNCVFSNSIELYRYQRSMNDYDFECTNYEWKFLDNIKLAKKKRSKISFKLFGLKFKLSWSK